MLWTVIRENGTKISTPGTMLLNGKFFCYTIEDVERPEIVSNPAAKVAGETAIPRGLYDVIVNRSPAFGRDMTLLLEVPHFAGVRIHSGNTADHSRGCVIVAKQRISPDRIAGDSRATETRVTELSRAAISRGEKVQIMITHVDELERTRAIFSD